MPNPPHSPAPPGRHHRLRNTALGIVGVLLTLVVAIGICEFLEWPFLRGPAQDKLSKLLDRDVRFGDQFGVRLIGSVRVHANEMTIGPAPNGGPTLVDETGKPRDFLHSNNVRLALGYGALYDQYKGTGKPLQVRLLDVDGLEVNLKRNADGHANWQFGAAQPATAASSPQLPQFEHLIVRNGEVRIEDQPLQIVADAHVTTREGTAAANASGASAPVAAASTSASAPRPMSPSSTPPAGLGIAVSPTGERIASSVVAAAASASARLDQAGPDDDDDTPGLRVLGTGTYRKARLVIALRSSGLLPLANSDADTPAVPLWLDARAGKSHIRLDGSATDLFHFGGMDASFSASGPSLAAVGDALGITLPTTAEFKTNGRLKKHGGVWNADVASLDIGTSRLRGDFTFDTTPAVPRLTGTLGGSRLALADLGPAFGAPAPDAPASAASAASATSAAAPGKAASAPLAKTAPKTATKTVKATPANKPTLTAAATQSSAAPGRVLPQREFDIPSLKAMNADVGVDLAVLDLGTDKLEPFTPIQAKITLQDGVLSLHDLLARTSMGQVRGMIGLDSRPALPKWNADLRWSGIELARFVKTKDTMVKKNADGTQPDTGYISGSLGGDAKLTGAGKSTAALMASLDGTTRMWVQDGQVSHLLVEAAGIDIADALGLYLKGDDKVPTQCAVAELTLSGGKVTPDVMVIDTHESTLVVGGNLSLADETLALRLNAHPHNFSPLAPRHFSPLAPRTPVDVDGTFSDPHVHLDAKPLLIRGGAAVALGLINPLAALLALIDLRQPERDVCTQAVAQLSQADRPGAVAPAASSAAGKPARAAAKPALAASATKAHP